MHLHSREFSKINDSFYTSGLLTLNISVYEKEAGLFFPPETRG